MAPHTTLRRALAATAGALALGPAAASAATITVDDDKLDCPSADYTSVQAGVNAAQTGDTVVICAGTYNEGPATVPTAGANAVNITKAITVKGAGASKVTIRPRADVPSLLGTTGTNFKTATGAVIGVNRNGVRQIVDISGITVEGNGVAVSAGVKFFDAEGSFTGSVVRTIAPLTAAQGYGVVVASNLVGDRLPVRVAGVSISGYGKGGIALDSTQLAPAAGILAVTITANTITGAGTQAIAPQQGIVASGLVSGTVTANAITGNRFDDGNAATTTDDRSSAGIRGVDLDMTPASATSTNSKLTFTGNNITGNGFGAVNETGAGADRVTASTAAVPPVLTSTNLTATGNWWGNAGGPSIGLPRTLGDPVNGATPGPAAGQTQAVNYSGFRTTAATIAASPSAIADAPPTGALDPPAAGDVVVPGKSYTLAATAADDFAVKSVGFSAGALDLGTDTVAPYAAPSTWTPGPELEGQTVTLTALVTDSSGVTTAVTRTVTVKTPPVVTTPTTPTTPATTPATDTPTTTAAPAPAPTVTSAAGPPAPLPPAPVVLGPTEIRSISLSLKPAKGRKLTVSGRIRTTTGTACPVGTGVRIAIYLNGRKTKTVSTKLLKGCLYKVTFTAPAKAANRKVIVAVKLLATKTTLAGSSTGRTVKVRR